MSQKPETDVVFLSLILNIHGAALQQMGKMTNPIDGKLERNMEAAKQSIDLLECMERKTRGNLSDDEEKTIQEILTNLRLNYVDELKKNQIDGAAAETESAAESEAEGADAGSTGD